LKLRGRRGGKNLMRGMAFESLRFGGVRRASLASHSEAPKARPCSSVGLKGQRGRSPRREAGQPSAPVSELVEAGVRRKRVRLRDQMCWGLPSRSRVVFRAWPRPVGGHGSLGAWVLRAVRTGLRAGCACRRLPSGGRRRVRGSEAEKVNSEEDQASRIGRGVRVTWSRVNGLAEGLKLRRGLSPR